MFAMDVYLENLVLRQKSDVQESQSDKDCKMKQKGKSVYRATHWEKIFAV